MSGDKDLMQLVSERVTMLDTMKNKLIGIEEVRAKFGVEPARVVEVQGPDGRLDRQYSGHSPGVGPKTAMKLIAEWHDLENVLSHSDAIKGKLGPPD